MKKLMITCALLTAISFASSAQSTQNAAANPAATPPMQAQRANHGAEMMAERRAKLYEKQLGLSADQYKGVYNAELEYMKQEQQARAGGQQPGQGQSAQMLMAKEQKFRSVMSAEQYTKYESMKPKPANAASAQQVH